MNRSRKINTPLTLCASALLTLLALNAPAYAVEPDEELEVTMDVIDDGDHAATTGRELVVREDHDSDDASHDTAEHESADHETAEHDAADEDHDEDASHDADDTDQGTEHEDADDSDVNDDGHDGAGEHSSDQPDGT